MSRAFDFYSVALSYGVLPKNFNQWEIKNDLGETLGHYAAYSGLLPKDYNQWELKMEKTGLTVAHTAAHNNCLPSEFNQWDLRDNNGWTVAHEAAFSGNLPDGFIQWDLKDYAGVNVKDVFEIMKVISNHRQCSLRISNDYEDKNNHLRERMFLSRK